MLWSFRWHDLNAQRPSNPIEVPLSLGLDRTGYCFPRPPLVPRGCRLLLEQIFRCSGSCTICSRTSNLAFRGKFRLSSTGRATPSSPIRMESTSACTCARRKGGCIEITRPLKPWYVRCPCDLVCWQCAHQQPERVFCLDKVASITGLVQRTAGEKRHRGASAREKQRGRTPEL